MNLANELDLAMDEAVKEHLKLLFKGYFLSREAPETKANQLKADMKLLEGDIEIATKVLEDI